MQTYTVQPGDTLYGISKQFGVTIEDIKTANNIILNNITPGQVLKIPTTETTLLYIVQRGDTLYSISKKYNVPVIELITLNNLTSNTLSVGQEIRIPVGTTDQTITYTVKKGDSLYSIANTYKVSVSEIKNLNSLTSNLLSIGQILKIPVAGTTPPSTPSTNYTIYTVKSGDSLYKIAQQFNMTVDELIALNNLKSTILTIGQQLKVLQENTPSTGEILECYGTNYQVPTFQTYTVQRGDSLYTISKKFNTSIENLIALNELKTDNLSIGQVLKIKENI